MKGDFTRVTHDPAKRYTKVLLQQGRVTLDADWNEQADIDEWLERLTSRDVVGWTGVPKETGGFLPQLVLDELVLTAGRLYANGLLCQAGVEQTGAEYTASASTTSDRMYVDKWILEGEGFEAGQWLDVRAPGRDPRVVKAIDVDADHMRVTFAPPLGPAYEDGLHVEVRRATAFSDQPFRLEDPSPTIEPPESGTERTDLLYLDVWQRHVTAIEDPTLREVALGGPDTTTRVQTVWQARVLPGDAGTTCEDLPEGWAEAAAPGGGRLSTLDVEPASEPEDPCKVVPGGGYRGLENRLYRVEIHEAGDLGGGASFKWSRDNGAVVLPIQTFVSGAPQAVLERVGPDEVLTVRPGDWVELLDDASELAGRPGQMLRVKRVDPGQRLVEFEKPPDDGYTVENHARIRRWDQTRDVATSGVLPVTDKPVELEDGVRVRFSGSNFKTGDHWVIAARTATGKVEPLERAPPRGIEHTLVPLATLDWAKNGGDWKLTVGSDCRPLFPPLTAITADDVSFDNGHCGLTNEDGEPASTVQEVIDAFCHERYLVLRYVGGSGQDAHVGQGLDLPFAVGVENESGVPQEGVLIKFEVVEGGGTLEEHGGGEGPGGSITVPTDAHGIAEVDYELGPEAGSQRVRATIPEPPQGVGDTEERALPVEFTVDATVPGLTLRHVAGDGQAAERGSILPCRLAVGVENESGVPAEGVEVEFDIVGSVGGRLVDGTLVEDPGGEAEVASALDEHGDDPVPVTTDGEGIARVHWGLGDEVGCHLVRARILKPPQGKEADDPEQRALVVAFAADVRDPPPEITWPRIDEISWPHDGRLALGVFNDEGLTVEFTELMHPTAALLEVFTVALELPEIHALEESSGEETTPSGESESSEVVFPTLGETDAVNLVDALELQELNSFDELDAMWLTHALDRSGYSSITEAEAQKLLNALDISGLSSPEELSPEILYNALQQSELTVAKPSDDETALAAGHRRFYIQGTVAPMYPESSNDSGEDLVADPSRGEPSRIWNFKPAPVDAALFARWIQEEARVSGRSELLVRVRLFSKFIYDAEGKRRLDGAMDVVLADGGPASDPPRMELETPPEEGEPWHEGRDFESWFYLEA